MASLGGNEKFLQQHGTLVRRVTAVSAALFEEGTVQLCGEPVEGSHRGRAVMLSRAAAPAIRRQSPARFAVAYADPLGETALAMTLAAMAGLGEPIAADPESLSVFALAERLAASDIPVLINGPTGTGKEVLSRFIHARSPRRKGPFIAVNCAAMPETMLEAMLFGHRKGSFTGATQESEGFMRAADGGTLLLDEIAELPLSLQAKLLRALQEQEVVPIGSTTPIKVDVRVIACANRDLPTEVAEGRFRADLFYRLNVFPLALRPLRERPEDVAPLAYGMVLRHAPDPARIPVISEAALVMLKLHQWPGNVRELENVVRRALLLAHGKDTITPEHIVFDSPARLIPEHVPAEAEVIAFEDNRKLSSIVQRSEAQAIVEVLEACGGNRMQAARELGISERTLRYRLASMREAGISVSRRVAGGLR